MIDYSVDADGVAVIAWNMADRSMNVLNDASVARFDEAVADALKDPVVKGVIVTSNKRDFLAGADLTQLGKRSDAAGLMAFSAGFHALLRGIEKGGKPFCAAINGTALGGGYEIALACHYRIAADLPRLQIGLPEVSIGLLPGGGGTQRLPRTIGTANALMHILMGVTLNPVEAAQKGFVQECVKGKALDRALEIAKRIATHTSQSVRYIKRLVRSATATPLAEGLALERNLFMKLCIGEPALERMRAYEAQRITSPSQTLR
jgi:3-hydroxyacyl-CoA dehydrogenase/enoyl-CoA hydratase/3-hydroxybutyryl-CoA epimerase